MKRTDKFDLQHSAYFKLVDILFRYPEKQFSLTELANEAGISKSNASINLDFLKSKGIVKVIDRKSMYLISANRDDPAFVRMKIAFNLRRIYDSQIIEKLENKYNNPKAIILFGSYRKGTDISSSDVDIAVESEQSGSEKPEDLRKIFGKTVQILKFSRKKVDLNVFNNIANGIVLSGFLEVNK